MDRKNDWYTPSRILGMLSVGNMDQPWIFGINNLWCKKQVGHALSVPDSEGSQLLPEDLGPVEPVSGLRP